MGRGEKMPTDRFEEFERRERGKHKYPEMGHLTQDEYADGVMSGKILHVLDINNRSKPRLRLMIRDGYYPSELRNNVINLEDPELRFSNQKVDNYIRGRYELVRKILDERRVKEKQGAIAKVKVECGENKCRQTKKY